MPESKLNNLRIVKVTTNHNWICLFKDNISICTKDDKNNIQ